MNKLKVGIVGMGFIGISHVDAIRRISCVELIAVADANYDLAKRKATEYNIPKCYGSIEELIDDSEIQIIHNCTPNNLHLSVNKQIIEAGKHIFSEKPLARSAVESEQLVELLEEYPDTVAGLNFCYRMNPLIQDAKNRIAVGEIGEPLLVHGNYLQDWLLFDTDYNWRMDPEVSGESRCVSDIGSHWMDTAQMIVGSKITEVCANLVIAHPVRKKPKGEVESFAKNTSTEYEEKQITTEDYAGVLVKFENGASGTFQCSQISAGRKCFIDIEVDGTLASFQWQHQNSDQMWKGNRDTNNEQIMRNPVLMTKAAKQYSYLAAGHPEGWNDAFKNNLQAFYDFICAGKKMNEDEHDFADFSEGHYIMRLTEAIMKSGREGRWVSVSEI